MVPLPQSSPHPNKLLVKNRSHGGMKLVGATLSGLIESAGNLTRHEAALFVNNDDCNQDYTPARQACHLGRERHQLLACSSFVQRQASLLLKL